MNHTEVKTEMQRRKSTTARMLEAFKSRGELTTNDLNAFGNGCSSRVFELRKEGHVIIAVYVKPGFYRYIYKGQKPEDSVLETTKLISDVPRLRKLFFRRRLEVQE